MIGGHYILIGEDNTTHKIVLSGTLLIEKKMIHNGGLVGHIEDIVVDQNYRNHGLGKSLIRQLVESGRRLNCYKVILDCSDKVIGFYEKCGLKYKDNCMAIYY